MPNKPKVVIVGGGFGGLNAAKRLGKAPVDVTLIDSSNHHLFQPLLYQVATATLSPSDVAMPIRHILKSKNNVEVLLEKVTGVDTKAKLVRVEDGYPVPYDYLVLATGATHSYFGHPEWEKVAKGLKTIGDATAIRSQILGAFELAEVEPDPAEKAKLLTFILVGAGPTGVEMSGAISEIAMHALTGEFRRINPESAKIILVEGGPRVLSTYEPALSQKALDSLQRRHVDVRLNTNVKGIDKNGVETDKGRIDAHTVIWTAGVKASPVAEWLGLKADRSGHVAVTPKLEVPGLANVFVIGDAMSLEQDGHPLPGVAQVAIQQGKYVAALIGTRAEGKAFEQDFHYRDLGSLATIGRSSAIAQFGKRRVSGFIAWVIWLFVHIMNLVGFRAKLSVLLQWAWSYFNWGRGSRIITQPFGYTAQSPENGCEQPDGS
jgi:NADH dehydrogenase